MVSGHVELQAGARQESNRVKTAAKVVYIFGAAQRAAHEVSGILSGVSRNPFRESAYYVRGSGAAHLWRE